MALPNSNISVSMVKQAIGSGSNDIGTLCTHPNINKWSKWKPMRSGSTNPLTEGEMSNAGWGLSFTEFSPNDTPIADAILYLRPRGFETDPGDPTEPYRLGDFRNYEHTATPSYFPSILVSPVNKAFPPYAVFWGINKNNNTGNAPLGESLISWQGTPPPGATSVRVKDLMVGVELRNASGTVISTQYTDNTVDNAISIKIDVTSVPVGIYTCHLFLFYDGYPNRRFTFPSYPAFPNHQNIEVVFDYLFDISHRNAYRLYGVNTQSIIMGGTTNDIPSAGSTTGTRWTVRISSRGPVIINLRDLYLRHQNNMLFETPSIDGSYDWAVLGTSSSAVTVNGNLQAFIPNGEWLDLDIKCNVTIKSGGPSYPSPYPVYYYIQYNGAEIYGQGSIWRNT